jgi:hypothetical protein
MRRLRTASLLALALLPCSAAPAQSAPEPATRARRFALVVGANRGSADRAPLRYAVADADRFASLVVRMGGVLAADSVVLREPTRQAFLDALSGMRARAAAAKSDHLRSELLLYFSGHADERGLMLGRESVGYRELRQAIAAIAADVGIAILDACASGAITRLKGGQSSPAFLTDESVQVQGYAFLTSSSENEAAQEAEHLKGSFFTHALLTGLRGAADASGDGKVTLGEAYQFAFSETIAQTAVTQAGAQHPAYDIKMAGTGDVVMTDVRENSASLILGPEYDGRILVMDVHRRLVAELVKSAGRRVELGLEPGQYQIYYVPENALLTATLRLAEGQHQELQRDGLTPAERLPTSRRGGEQPPQQPTDNLDGRWRILFQGGVTHISAMDTPTQSRAGGASGGLQISRWIRRDLALDLRIHSIDVEAVETINSSFAGADLGFLVGARYHPQLAGGLRPHVGGSIGAFSQTGATESFGVSTAGMGDTRLGGTLEGGVDIRLGGHFLFNVDGILTLRDERSSRFDVAIGFGFIFGSGRRPGAPRRATNRSG